MRGCCCGVWYARRQTISQSKPSNPGSTNAGRHPQRKYTGNTRNGATALPIDDPLSNSAVANPRSRFGNHSETAFVAPGQLADSLLPEGNETTRSYRSPWLAE